MVPRKTVSMPIFYISFALQGVQPEQEAYLIAQTNENHVFPSVRNELLRDLLNDTGVADAP